MSPPSLEPSVPLHHAHPYKPTSAWLTRFREDPFQIDDACALWYNQADGFVDDLNYPETARTELPEGLDDLTQLLALWCDVELHIDPTALTEFQGLCFELFPTLIHHPNGLRLGPPRPKMGVLYRALQKAGRL